MNHEPSIKFAPRSQKHLNGHSVLITQQMAIHFAPLDSPYQRASFKPKKIYLAFSILEKFAKKQKTHSKK
jgi:hypothetical protein